MYGKRKVREKVIELFWLVRWAAAGLRTRLFDHAVLDNKTTTQDLTVTKRKITDFIKADRVRIEKQEKQIRYWQQRTETAEASLNESQKSR
ncbi:hypothetical protein N0V90_008827 [Kalmusia sp. IMI 367209]|nr:hypothetical protein N0V90_008827 [Kalmusia sp. IMI 367209]